MEIAEELKNATGSTLTVSREGSAHRQRERRPNNLLENDDGVLGDLATSEAIS
ncbi:hypothetical protein CGRA01v4_06131 [Colletotrichum graminicola]|nr:hypothetical protein CGRA01v4_06131 [Colletotrichum graminicola]